MTQRPNPSAFVARDLENERAVHAVTIEHIKAHCADDPDFLHDAIEGETDIFRLLDRLDSSMPDDEAVVAGADAVIKKFQARKTAALRRIDEKKAIMENTLLQIGVKTHRTETGVNLTLRRNPFKAKVVDDMKVPLEWWKRPEPAIDQKSLTDRVKEHMKARAAAEKIGDEEERRNALAQVDEDFPIPPGVEIDGGNLSLWRA